MTLTFLPESFSSAAVICGELAGVERLRRDDLGGDAAGAASIIASTSREIAGSERSRSLSSSR